MPEIDQNTVKQENIKVYAHEAKTYDILHPEVWNWYEQLRYRRLVNKTMDLLSRKKEPVIVDVGAGTGNLTLKYLKKGCRVISVDISKEMLSVLESKLTVEQKSRCQIIAGDVETALKNIDKIDGVCFSSVLHHLFDYNEVINEFILRMNPGAFFFNVHDPLVQTPKSRIRFKMHRFIGSIDEKLYKWNAKRTGYDISKFPDDAIAEYHQRNGTIKADELVLFLKKSNLEIVNYETCTSRRYGFFAWLSSSIIKSENAFSIIARKL